MKVTSVLLNPIGASDDYNCVMSFRDPTRQNPYNVKAIIGLDAEEIVPRYYGGSGSSRFYELVLEKRTIVIRAGLNPQYADNETFSDLRNAIYKLISSSRKGLIQVQFKNGIDIVASISGFVTKVEYPHFNKEQEVQITVLCDDSMLKALNRVSVDVEDLVPSSTVIEDTESTAPHGFIFVINLMAPMDSLKITDPNDALWSFEFVPAGGFLTFDELHFSSEHNDKYLYIVRGVNTIHLANVITPGSVWPIMFPGENTFNFSNPVTNDPNLVWESISYYPTYWGV